MPTLRITRKAVFSVGAVLAIAFNPVSSGGQASVNVTTWHNDNWRTGQNTNENTLRGLAHAFTTHKSGCPTLFAFLARARGF